MAKVKGGDLMLFVGTQGAEKSIAYATSHTLDISAELKDASNKDEGGGDWSTQEVGLLSWTASTENLYTTSGKGNQFATLFDSMIAKTPISAVFTLKKESGTEAPNAGWQSAAAGAQSPKYSGKVIINSLNVTAQNGEYATMSATFTGVGALTKTTT